MNWLAKLFNAYIEWWADHLPHSPVREEVHSDQPKPIEGTELVPYAELEQA